MATSDQRRPPAASPAAGPAAGAAPAQAAAKPAGTSTLAVHAGRAESPAKPFGDPIYQVAAFTFPSVAASDATFAGSVPGHVYTRFGNPNTDALAQGVAALEGAPAGAAFASGMGAITCLILAAAGPGSHIVAQADVYGGTRHLLAGELGRLGFSTTFADGAEVPAFRAACRADTRIFLVETVSNPLLRVADIAGLAALAAERGAVLVVDNTFATPCLYQPLAEGAHAVAHSATKALGGHGDLTAGVIAGPVDLVGRAQKIGIGMGFSLDPFAAWLACRGIKTLALRVERSSANALHCAGFLAGHPAVAAVFYPGLRCHPEHERARRMFSGVFGSMLSFTLRGGLEAVERFVARARLIRFVPSLGDVATTVTHPASTSHRSIAPEERRRMGIEDGLLRLSLGIEDAHDILSDLDLAL